MEVRSLNVPGTNRALVEIWHDGQLFAKIDCYERLSKSELTIDIPANVTVTEIRRPSIVRVS